MRTAAALLGAALLPLPLFASPFAEVRAYPTGSLWSLGWSNDADAEWGWGAHASFNVADRGDAGRQDDEEGEGYGLGGFVSTQPAWLPKPLHLAARLELYRLNLDWQTGAQRGKSRVTVLLPTAELGYRLPWSSAHWQWQVNASAGAEINLQTSGAPVGEGVIGLVGLRLNYQP